MAVLEKIRNRAGILVAVIGIALLAFLAGDIIRGGSSLMRDRDLNAFTINGKSVKIQDFEEQVRRTEERYRNQSVALNETQSHELRNQVYSQLITEQVLKEEAQKIGVSITPEETFDLVQGDFISPVILQNPMFVNPQTGVFDKNGLLEFLKTISGKSATGVDPAQLQTLKDAWLDTEHQVRIYQLNNKYNNLLSKGIVANKLDVAYLKEANDQVVDLAYTFEPNSSVADSLVTISDNDIKAYYDSHTTLFKSNAGGVIDIIYASITPSEQDYEMTKADMQSAAEELRAGASAEEVLSQYSDNAFMDVYFSSSEIASMQLPLAISSFLSEATVGAVSDVIAVDNSFNVVKLIDKKIAPSEVEVSHIILDKNSSISTDSLLSVIKQDVTKFGELATQYSLDQNSATNGGKIGLISEAQATQYLGADFAKAIFNAEINMPFKLDTQYGEQIVLVTKKGDNTDKVKFAWATKAVTPSTETQTELYNNFSALVANKDLRQIDSLATAQGFMVQKDLRFDATQSQLTPFLPNTRQVIHWAMTNKEGAISDIMETQEYYLVAKVVDKFDAGILPLDLVKDNLAMVVRNEKKGEHLFEQYKSNAIGKTLESIATDKGLSIDSLHFVNFDTRTFDGIGMEPAINAVAKVGELNSVIPVKGNSGVYMIQVLKQTQEPAPQSDEQMKRGLTQNLRSVALSQTISEMIRMADIEDNRYKFN